MRVWEVGAVVVVGEEGGREGGRAVQRGLGARSNREGRSSGDREGGGGAVQRGTRIGRCGPARIRKSGGGKGRSCGEGKGL